MPYRVPFYHCDQPSSVPHAIDNKTHAISTLVRSIANTCWLCPLWKWWIWGWSYSGWWKISLDFECDYLSWWRKRSETTTPWRSGASTMDWRTKQQRSSGGVDIAMHWLKRQMKSLLRGSGRWDKIGQRRKFSEKWSGDSRALAIGTLVSFIADTCWLCPL